MRLLRRYEIDQIEEIFQAPRNDDYRGDCFPKKSGQIVAMRFIK